MSVPNFTKQNTLSPVCFSPNKSEFLEKVPKREMGQPVSPYQMFTLLERPKVLIDLGNIADNEVVDEIARRWSALDEESKDNLGKLSGNDVADEVAKRWTAFDEDLKGKLKPECIKSEVANIESANIYPKECNENPPNGKEQEVKNQEVGHPTNLDNYFAFLLFNWRSVSNSNLDRSGMEIQEIIWKQWLQKNGQGIPSAKSKKKIRDSDAPKRPLSSYILFANSQRADLVKNKPNISNKDILVELGKMWSSMDEESKRPYVARSNELKVAYHVAVEERKLQKEANSQIH